MENYLDFWLARGYDVVMLNEIDPTDLRALEKTEAKLQHLLSVVQFAIAGLKKTNPSNSSSVVLTDDDWGQPPTKSDAEILEHALVMAPQKFKSSLIYAMTSPVSRPTAKSFLREQVHAGRINVLAYGKGKRATIYEKTPIF